MTESDYLALIDRVYNRAQSPLTLRRSFGKPAELRFLGPMDTPKKEQMILRMLICGPETGGYRIPPELNWLAGAIVHCVGAQKAAKIHQPFVYVTVRSGLVSSIADDEWHVDGFSMRVPHPPEQNYIWCDSYPTEVIEQRIEIPMDFDPLRHNLHWYLQGRVEVQPTRLLPQTLYLIDPYVIHRRPPEAAGKQRTFFRISFVPIEIEDDTNTPNPLLPTKTYDRIGTEIRSRLGRYGP